MWAQEWGGWYKFNPAWAAHKDKALLQLGTLGGGNHFIELCEDEQGQAWAMLHSGSRAIGKNLADVHMKAAKEQCARNFVELPDKDLAYLVEGTPEFDAYIEAVTWCQGYAWENRLMMSYAILKALGIQSPGEFVHCHHNYVTKEAHFGENVWLTRKGAVCAREGMKGIIPGSMGSRSYIVEGLGNPQSFHSCSHGAGRKMGRKEAARHFTIEDLAKQTEGVECRKDSGVLDEIPGAYKDIDVVMENQKDLVKPIHTLKQFLCIKG
jgi:tRNA-splicing ligase RtcB